MFFDRIYKNEVAEVIRPQAMEVFDPRFEDSLYVTSFARAFFRWLRLRRTVSFTVCYFLVFLENASPRRVITAADNSSVLYESIERQGNGRIRFLIIQNGVRRGASLPTMARNTNRVRIIAITEAQGELFRGQANGPDVHALGSLPMKLLSTGTGNENHPASAAFISQWRTGFFLGGKLSMRNHRGDFIEHSQFFAPECLSLIRLFEALKKLGISLDVLGSSDSHPQLERKFYVDILGQHGWTFSPREPGKRSYAKLHEYGLLFSVDSTLAYEALTSLHRTMFLPTQGATTRASQSMRMQFGYPYHERLGDHSFLLQPGKESNWERQIHEVVNLTDSEFRRAAEMVVGKDALASSRDDFEKFLRDRR